MNEWVASATLIATLVSVVVGIIVSLIKARRSDKAIEQIHLLINSRMDQLLQLTKSTAHAAGVQDEKDNKNG